MYSVIEKSIVLLSLNNLQHLNLSMIAQNILHPSHKEVYYTQLHSNCTHMLRECDKRKTNKQSTTISIDDEAPTNESERKSKKNKKEREDKTQTLMALVKDRLNWNGYILNK